MDPIKNGDIPASYVSETQRVTISAMLFITKLKGF